MKKRVLILGSTSWLGSSILHEAAKIPDYKFISTKRNLSLAFSADVDIYPAFTPKDYENIFFKTKPDIIINFLRGEDEEGFRIHQKIIQFCNNHTTHYVYASSVLALDSYENKVLSDDLKACSVSEYGMFKARCEELLYESKIRWSILRFASLQGYCAHKPSRNELFLRRLQKGETIYVDSGVIQNRLFINDMTNMISHIIRYTITGIIHLGTIDSSEEIIFLKKLAIKFGYKPDVIKPSKIQRNINLNCRPSLLKGYENSSTSFYENRTLEKLYDIPEFQKYRKI